MGFGFATGDGDAPKLFDGLVERRAGLLAQHFAQQHAERTDVAAQRSFFELAGRGLKFGEALGPVGWRPEGRHPLIMPWKATEGSEGFVSFEGLHFSLCGTF